jgi:hypothetical protein
MNAITYRGVDTVVSRLEQLGPEWSQVLATELGDRWRGGVLVAQAQINMGSWLAGFGDSTTAHFLAVDLRVLGYLGGTPATICRASLSGFAGPITLELSDLDTFTRLVVLARRRISGGDRVANVASYGGASAPDVTLSAQARFVKA